MKKIMRNLFMLVICFIILTACGKQNQPIVPVNKDISINKIYFIEPYKIIIYKKDNTQIISKDNKLFYNIFNQMNDRVSKQIGVFRLGFDENNMRNTKQKELVVEFVYSNSQKSKFGIIEKEYNNLIFPLTGEYNQCCFFDDGKGDYSGPMGSLKNSITLLDLLK